MQSHHPLTVAALCAALLLSGCSTTGSKDTSEKDWSAATLYNASKKALKRGDAAGAVRHLETLQVRFPLTDYAQQAQLDIILAYYRREEYDYAITSADHFIQLNPQSQHNAYVWYMKGRCELARTKGMLEKYFPRDMASTDQQLVNTARSHFDHVTQHYPDSPWAEASQQQSALLLDELAEHELLVAQFYYDRGAYVGAANRINTLLNDFPQSTHRTAALTLLIDCYTQQGLHQQAKALKAQLPS